MKVTGPSPVSSTILKNTMPNYYNTKTSDDKDELLTRVDERDNVIGEIKREDCHNETVKPWHRTIHIYILNDKGQLYLTRRSHEKDTAPNDITVSVCGHVRYKEEPPVTAQRELQEELNLNIPLKYITKYKVDYGFEKEFIYVFFGRTDKQPEIFKQEVMEIIPMDIEKTINDFSNGSLKLSPGSSDVFKLLIENNLLKKENFLIKI